MYHNFLKKAFLDVKPEISDEEFVDKILCSAERKRPRAIPKKAVAIPLAVLAAASAAFGVSAAGGTNMIKVLFATYFSPQTEDGSAVENASGAGGVNLEAVGMTGYEKTIPLNEYTVEVNGLIADSSWLYISYDVTYKDSDYLENGEVKDYFKEHSPILFFPRNTESGMMTAGWGEGIGMSGNTVSYVQMCSGEFRTDPATGEYKLSLELDCGTGEEPGIGMTLYNEVLNVSIPPAEEITVPINEEITLPDGSRTILKEAYFGPLSMRLLLSGESFFYQMYGSAFELILKDGTSISLQGKSAIMRSMQEVYAQETPPESVPAQTTAEPSPDMPAQTTFSKRNQESAEFALASERVESERGLLEESDSDQMLYIGYDTAIDPKDLAELRIADHVIPIARDAEEN